MENEYRVLHVLQRMEPAGVQTLLMNLYKNIDRNKIQFDFLVHYKTPQFFDDEIKKMGGNVFRLSFREDYNLFKYLRDLDMFFKKHQNYKIVHGHMHTLGFFYLKAAKKNGIPIRIAHAHTNNTQKDFKLVFKLIMNKLYAKYATHLFACSEDAGVYMFGKKKFKVINNAIDSNKFRFNEKNRNEIRKELNIENNFVIGCVGRFTKQKNQKFSLEIYKELLKKIPKSKLLFIGTGEMENEVKELVNNYGLNNNVLFLENRNDMEKIYCAMDVFLFPSLFEGLGIVGVEAQAAGTPVVCTDTLPSEMSVTPLVYRVSLNNGVDKWVDAILEAKDNKQNHTDMSKYIKENNYDIENLANYLAKFYTNHSDSKLTYQQENKNKKRVNLKELREKKKVIIVLNRLGGFGWGGAHRVSVILANYLINSGYEVELIAWDASTIDYPIDSKIKIHDFNLKIRNEKDRIKACLLTRKILKKNKGAYVYVLTSRMATDIYISSLFCGVKVIGAERTDPNREPKKKIFRIIRNIAFTKMYKTVYQTVDAKKYFPKQAQKKGTVIFNPLSPNLPEPYNGKRKKEFITFCRIDNQKNLYLMIDAFINCHKKHNDFILKIYGDGLIKNEIKRYIISHNAENFILLRDFSKNIHEKILDSYAYINSSDYEGMSNSMLEALAIGLPSICTDCPIGGAKTIIKNGENGILVPVNNLSEMELAINKLIENKELCEKLSKNACKIREKLSIDNICSQWERLMYKDGESL